MYKIGLGKQPARCELERMRVAHPSIVTDSGRRKGRVRLLEWLAVFATLLTFLLRALSSKAGEDGVAACKEKYMLKIGIII